ncbi:hypothetical protein KAR91_83690 [Candidatus Pacearchaeota archaeon]|nr:hypothetical protein [Candidatus Pacearchaeota archaeon]
MNAKKLRELVILGYKKSPKEIYQSLNFYKILEHQFTYQIPLTQLPWTAFAFP